MLKKVAIVLVVALLVSLSACGCLHDWTDATCTEAKTCAKCGEVQGEALGHVWQENSEICTVCNFDNRPIDEQFMDHLVRGLEARWVLTTSTSATTKEHWESYFDAEYNEIIAYEKADFENKELGEWAKAYIKSIVEAKAILNYVGTNQWESKYTNGIYNDRCEALFEINEICPVEVSAENYGLLIDILSHGEAIKLSSYLFENLVFEYKSGSYGWKEYEALVKNTTSLTFESFWIDVDLIDEDGVTVETTSAYIENWDPGETVRCELSTYAKFKEMDIESMSWYY